jgi:hypothetical protein
MSMTDYDKHSILSPKTTLIAQTAEAVFLLYRNKLVFAIISHLNPNLIFVGKVVSQPLESSPVIGSSLVSSSLTCKHHSRVVVTDISKHSSLLWHGKKYGRKKFNSTVSSAFPVKCLSGAPLKDKLLSLP